jgi:hypothetical protein
MEAELQKLETAARNSPAYARAGKLLVERERLERQMQEIDRELETLAVAGQLARIDRLRHELLASAKTFVLAG